MGFLFACRTCRAIQKKPMERNSQNELLRKIKQKSHKRIKVKLAVQLWNTAAVFHISFGIHVVLATAVHSLSVVNGVLRGDGKY